MVLGEQEIRTIFLEIIDLQALIQGNSWINSSGYLNQGQTSLDIFAGVKVEKNPNTLNIFL